MWGGGEEDKRFTCRFHRVLCRIPEPLLARVLTHGWCPLAAWWKDQNYLKGKLSIKTRTLRVVNILSS